MIGRTLYAHESTEVGDNTRTPAIMTKAVYTRCHVEVLQMINLLRLLTVECHGSPARSQQNEARDGTWDLSSDEIDK